MLSFTRPRFFHPRLLALLVVAGGLASGCQSSRPSFSFQPIVLRAAAPVHHTPATATPVAVVVTSNAPDSGAMSAQSGVVTTAAVVKPGKAPMQPVIPITEKTQPQATRPENLVVATALTTAAPARAAGGRWAGLRRRELLHRPHAPAAQGLGLTVLGLLGMVALVVALIGLAISGGGMGWIITAAVAAGIVLLAYIDPGGH